MRTLSPGERRALRAKAHLLDPVVSIGQHGLTPAVLHEIDVNLAAHELIKIRVFAVDRDVRGAMLAQICAELDAAAVQHLGKVLIVWRPAPPEESRPPRTASGAKSAAKKAPQARRPRTPAPRTPARPAPASWRGKTPLSTPGRPPPRGGGKAATAGSKAAPDMGSRRRSRGPAPDAAGQERRYPSAPAGRRATSGRDRGPRPAANTAGKPSSGRAKTPHGKSISSTTGASGARRRRKARA
jgi:putative YhbY family RNA-binding protein